MDTLLKSFDSFAEKHGSTSFFLAHPNAGDILSQVSPQFSGPVHLHSDLEHAQNFLPHHSAVEFVLTPEAKVADIRTHPRSLTGVWDLTHDEDEGDPHGAPIMPKSQLIADGLVDAIWHEFNDTLEVHNHEILIPVGLHPPIQPHTDVEALPLAGEIDSEGDTVVMPESFEEAFGLPASDLHKLAEEEGNFFGGQDLGRRPDPTAPLAKKGKVVKPGLVPDILPSGTDYGRRPAFGRVDAEASGLRDFAEYPMFKRDQPAIGAFAQQNADNMARLLIFVVASIKIAWPLMQYYFPMMFDVLSTKGTVQYPQENKPIWIPLVIGKVKTLDYLWANRGKLYTGLMRAVEKDQTAGNTGFMVYKQMILVPGLGVPKAGFATQLLVGRYGCIDSVNLNLLNAKAPTHLMTKDGKAFKPASQISVPDSGGDVLSGDEFRHLISSDKLNDDQKQLVTFLYGALTRKSVEVLQGYVDYLKALELEGTGCEQLWDIWCSVIAHKIQHGGFKKRPIDVVLPNQTKPSRVQAYAAIPRDLLAKSQASVRNKDGSFDVNHGGDVISGDHRRLIRGESKILRARKRK